MNSKKIITGTSITLIFIIAIIAGGVFYLLSFSLRPDFKHKDIPHSIEYAKNRYEGFSAWYDSVQSCHALRDTFLTSADGVRLHAYYVKVDSAKRSTMVIHGYTDNSIRMMMLGQMYEQNMHYNIFMPDLRFHGLSGGNSIQMGWRDRLDIEQLWMPLAHQIFEDTLMIVHGISMGGATTMMISGDSLPPYVQLFVEDCGYTSVWDQFSKELKQQFGLPSWPLLNIASWVCDLKYGWNFKEASALNQVAKSTKPMLFIHGDKDDYVPTDMVYKVFDAKKQGFKRLWIVPETAHAASYRNHTKEYTQRVKQFIDDTVGL